MESRRAGRWSVGWLKELFARQPIRGGWWMWIAVALVSAAIFAALHSGNLLTGQSLFATLFQILYTFAFGICMYLALRVTGNLVCEDAYAPTRPLTAPPLPRRDLVPARAALARARK